MRAFSGPKDGIQKKDYWIPNIDAGDIRYDENQLMGQQ
jgi:hypothetical protein